MARIRLAGRKVLVTGAGSGLGLGMAEAFGRLGAQLVLWDLDVAALRRASERLAALGVMVRTDVVDLARRDDVYRVARQVIDEVGPVDVLVNNAGIVSGLPLLDQSDDDIARTFDVNALALFWTTRAFMPAMVRQGSGHIVTIASAGGLVGTSRLVDYCASKFAAVGFDDALRVEAARLGLPIRTTVVCPMYVSTGMFEGVSTRVPWILPILDPDLVVRRIVRAVIRGRRRLIIPRFAYVVFLLRLLPVPWFDRVSGWFGINRTMDHFVGRAGSPSTGDTPDPGS